MSGTTRIPMVTRGLIAAIAVTCLAVWSAPASADPPPWAPAWGYRAQGKHKNKQRLQQAYSPQVPFGIDLGRCNREALGSLLGAAAGGYAGSQIGSGNGQLAAVAGGTILGFIVGGTIGRSMDELDQNCVGQALEHAEDGQRIIWNNPTTSAQYQVVPSKTYQRSDGQYCRRDGAALLVAPDLKLWLARGAMWRQADALEKPGGRHVVIQFGI